MIMDREMGLSLELGTLVAMMISNLKQAITQGPHLIPSQRMPTTSSASDAFGNAMTYDAFGNAMTSSVSDAFGNGTTSSASDAFGNAMTSSTSNAEAKSVKKRHPRRNKIEIKGLI